MTVVFFGSGGFSGAPYANMVDPKKIHMEVMNIYFFIVYTVKLIRSVIKLYAARRMSVAMKVLVMILFHFFVRSSSHPDVI